MYRTAVRDLQQSLALGCVQRSSEFDLPLYLINLTEARLAVFAVTGMNLVVLQAYFDALQIPALVIRITYAA